MTAFAGLRGTGDFATGERPENYREVILRLSPNGTAPLFALMSRMGEESIDDPTHHWFEEEHANPRVQTSSALSSSSTSVELDTGDANVNATGLDYVPGDLLLVETDDKPWDNEVVEVSSVISSTAVVLKRAAVGTSAAGISSGTYLTRTGNIFEEGEGSPNVSTFNPTKLHNYTQIFKTAYELTNTTKQTNFRTGDPLRNDRIRKMFHHSASIEWELMMGRRNENLSGPVNSKPRRSMGGLLQYITTHRDVSQWDSQTTENDLLDFLDPLFNWTVDGMPNERLVLAGNGFFNDLNKLIKDSSSSNFNWEGTLEMWGVRLTRLRLPQGEIAVKTHPLLSQHPRFRNSAFIIAPQGLKWMPLRGRDTKEDKGPNGRGIQANDEDKTKFQWLTEATIEVRHEKTMGYIGNFDLSQ